MLRSRHRCTGLQLQIRPYLLLVATCPSLVSFESIPLVRVSISRFRQSSWRRGSLERSSSVRSRRSTNLAPLSDARFVVPINVGAPGAADVRRAWTVGTAGAYPKKGGHQEPCVRAT